MPACLSVSVVVMHTARLARPGLKQLPRVGMVDLKKCNYSGLQKERGPALVLAQTIPVGHLYREARRENYQAIL